MSVSSKHLRQIGAIYFLWETVFVKGHFMRFIILLYSMINITIHVPEIIKKILNDGSKNTLSFAIVSLEKFLLTKTRDPHKLLTVCVINTHNRLIKCRPT